MSEVENSFSALMPVHNQIDPKLFKKALQSVIENSLKPSEFVIVLDGPLKQELNWIISNYSDNKKVNIKTIRLKENRGIVDALNLGLENCSYELIARCDADDINHYDRFSLQVDAFKSNHDLTICGGQIIEIGNKNEKYMKSVPLSNSEILKFSYHRNPFNHMTVMFKKSFILSIGGYKRFHYREDYALWCNALSKGASTRNLNNVLVYVDGGTGMYKRRGNIFHLKYEFLLQKYLLSIGHINRSHYFINLILRGGNMVAGTTIRGIFYENFLRIKQSKEAKKSKWTE